LKSSVENDEKRSFANELTQNPKAVPMETGGIVGGQGFQNDRRENSTCRKRDTEEQIITALKQYESGEKVADICRKVEVSQASFYTWKKK